MIMTITVGYIICFVIFEILLIALFFYLLYKKIQKFITKISSFSLASFCREMFGDAEAFFGVIVFLFLEFEDNYCQICKKDFQDNEDELITRL